MYTGANIVTDGLVLALDAANPKSYVSGSSVWRDLSGNGINAATGSNVVKPSYSSFAGGSIYFMGVTGSGNIEAPIMRIFGTVGPPQNAKLYLTGSLTMEVWFRPDALYSGSGEGTIMRAGGGTDQMYAMFWLDSSRIVSYQWYDGAFKGYSTQIAVSKVLGNHVVMSKNDTSLTIYFNGSQVASTTVTNTTNTQFGSLEIGNNNGSTGQKFNGDISVVKVYKRALSPTEVLQNYNATKARFGL